MKPFDAFCSPNFRPKWRRPSLASEVAGHTCFAQDGDTFFNRENRLSRRRADHYREYTVETPGSSNRGARRLVVGGGGAELYYTDDHYRTFREVAENHD